MITFSCIEDYLEVLAGFRQITKSGPSIIKLFTLRRESPISLARYDIVIINSMAEATVQGTALTDRQADLAVKLVSKYQKQFAKLKVDVTSSVQNPTFRFPPRLVDRTKSVSIDNNQIVIKFPYNKELVSLANIASNNSNGHFKFNYDKKEWRLAITESNVNWAVSLNQYGFTVDEEITALMQLILDCEQHEYKIELVKNSSNTFEITNAEPSLTQYIENNIGGFSQSNLTNLVDFSSYGGYTVSESIQKELGTKFDPLILEFLLNKDSHFIRNDLQSDGVELLTPLIEYATLTNRWPIYVFEPEASDCLQTTLNQLFTHTEIFNLASTKIKDGVDFSSFKCVYFKKLKQMQKFLSAKIPLIVSTSAIEHKHIWGLHAEKVVYYTATTYNQGTVKIVSKINY